MLGNVWEWCHDGRRDYESELAIDPVGQAEAGAGRVFRGGGWAGPARLVRAAFRGWDVPGYRYPYFGFRCLSSGSEPGSGGPGRPEGVRQAEAKGGAAEGRSP